MAVNIRFVIPRCWFSFQYQLKYETYLIHRKSTTLRVFDPFCLGYSVAWMGLHVEDDLACSLHPLSYSGLGLVGDGFIPCDLGLSRVGFGGKTRAHSQSTNPKFSGPYQCDFNIGQLVHTFWSSYYFVKLKSRKMTGSYAFKEWFYLNLNLGLWYENVFIIGVPSFFLSRLIVHN